LAKREQRKLLSIQEEVVVEENKREEVSIMENPIDECLLSIAYNDENNRETDFESEMKSGMDIGAADIGDEMETGMVE
jgi:hypothetical protein